jgi:hypothetical protein
MKQLSRSTKLTRESSISAFNVTSFGATTSGTIGSFGLREGINGSGILLGDAETAVLLIRVEVLVVVKVLEVVEIDEEVVLVVVVVVDVLFGVVVVVLSVKFSSSGGEDIIGVEIVAGRDEVDIDLLEPDVAVVVLSI